MHKLKLIPQGVINPEDKSGTVIPEMPFSELRYFLPKRLRAYFTISALIANSSFTVS
jgi:hypothetical protein